MTPLRTSTTSRSPPSSGATDKPWKLSFPLDFPTFPPPPQLQNHPRPTLPLEAGRKAGSTGQQPGLTPPAKSIPRWAAPLLSASTYGGPQSPVRRGRLCRSRSTACARARSRSAYYGYWARLGKNGGGGDESKPRDSSRRADRESRNGLACRGR
ncbi:hypothetical protein VTK26DRAFT_7189 [Humicola hyalothermophila]